MSRWGKVQYDARGGFVHDIEGLDDWPVECYVFEAVFGHRTARCYPLLGQLVSAGGVTGVLKQVFDDWAMVLPDGADRLRRVRTADVRPLGTNAHHREGG